MIRTRGHHGAPARRAFTLVELIATIVVLGVVSAAASGILMSAVDGYTDASVSAQLHTEMSIALDRLSRELRNIPLDTAAAGIAPDVDLVTTNTIQFGDGSAISLIGSTLMLRIGAGTPASLVTDVTAVTVAAYDESDVVLALPLSGSNCDPVRRFELTVTATRSGATDTLRTRVFLRSTMTGASAGS